MLNSGSFLSALGGGESYDSAVPVYCNQTQLSAWCSFPEPPRLVDSIRSYLMERDASPSSSYMFFGNSCAREEHGGEHRHGKTKKKTCTSAPQFSFMLRVVQDEREGFSIRLSVGVQPVWIILRQTTSVDSRGP